MLLERNELERMTMQVESLAPLFDAVGSATFIFDRNTLLYVNEAAAQLTGMSKTLLLEKGLDAIIHYRHESRPMIVTATGLQPIQWTVKPLPQDAAAGLFVGTVIPIILSESDDGLYRDMFEKNTAIKLLFDFETMRVVDANSAASEFYGYSREEFLQLKLSDLSPIPPDRIREHMSAIRTHQLQSFQTVNRLASGEIRHVQVNSGPIYHQGRLLLFSIVNDITEHVKALEELHANEQKYRSIVDQSTDGVLLTDESGTVIEWNRGCEGLTGISREDALGHKVWDIQHQSIPPQYQTPKQLQLVREAIELLLKTGEISPLLTKEYNIVHRNGTPYTIQPANFPIKAANGYMLGSIVRDITGQRDMERHLRESETLLKGVLDSSLAGIMAFEAFRDENNVIVDFVWQHVNAAAERLLGVEKGKLIGNRLLDVMPGNRKAGLFNLYVQVVETGIPFNNEYFYDYEGIRAWFHIIAFKREDGFVVTYLDITDRKRITEMLRRNEEMYRTLVNNFPNGAVALFDHDLRYTLVGGRGLAEDGLSRTDLENKTIYEIYSPDVQAQIEPLFKMTLEGRRGLQEVIAADKVHLVQTIPIMDASGAIHGGLVMTQNITQTKHAAEMLLRQEKMLVELNKEAELHALKDKIMTTISHELRTPLAIILSSSETLRTHSPQMDAEKRARYFDRIRLQVEHMTAIVEDISLAVRGIKTVEGLQPLRFDFVRMCKEVIEESQSTFARNHHLYFETPAASLPFMGDERLLRGMLLNLMANAAKYSPTQSEIHLRLALENGHLTLWIKDMGRGISPEDQQRIFEPFFRGGDTNTVGGMGIGLALVKDCVLLHKGTIKVDSSLGKGTTFIIRLPIVEYTL